MFTKGLSFNVTLSTEQIEEIASLTADKVNYTSNIRHGNEEYYIREIENLKQQISERDRMIAQKEIEKERLLSIFRRHRETISKYRDRYGELTD